VHLLSQHPDKYSDLRLSLEFGTIGSKGVELMYEHLAGAVNLKSTQVYVEKRRAIPEVCLFADGHWKHLILKIHC
jgi:hypothetical protein